MAWLLLGLLAPARVWSETSDRTPVERILLEGLAIKLPEDIKGRSGFSIDPIEGEIVRGKVSPTKAGDRVAFPEGKVERWRAVRAGPRGWFEEEALEGGYVRFSVPSAKRELLILDAMGDDMVFVNGVPRAGNQYGLQDEYKDWETRFDYSLLPIALEAGRNDLLFKCYRGRLRVALRRPPAEATLNPRDLTLPDLLVGERIAAWGAIVVINASMAPLRGALLVIEPASPMAPLTRTVTPIPDIPPLSLRKIRFKIEGGAPEAPGDVVATVALVRGAVNRDLSGRRRRPGAGPGARSADPGKETRAASGPLGAEESREAPPLDSATITLKAPKPGEPYKRTFLSGIDGSVQYYAVNPAGGHAPGRPVALFLSLHGAAVEAINQARAYSQKSWGAIVAPTGRRPYGYNWEDWGRIDALEVLALAQQELTIDPDRIYLTGHSMGGHGSWHLGETFPDLFAAVGPSAGWLSFWTYRARKEPDPSTPIGRILLRAASPSDTLALARNLEAEGVYVIHGRDDDNVPVTESRRMVERLGAFHKDLVYHEEPGAGHWWDLTDAPGADCVDWAPLFDFFARRARPGKERVRQVEFMTANPGISASCYWLGIEAQTEPLTIGEASVRCDPAERRFTGSTKNVARIALDPEPLPSDGAVTVQLDGQEVAGIPRPADGGTIRLSRQAGRWSWLPRVAASEKGPGRYGPFKEAFRNHVLFVYGTRGTKEENAWAFAKARYDAERFWYQGNGSVEVIPDAGFLPAADPDRNVILYGNARTNGAWSALLHESPVQVDEGSVRIGARTIRGTDLACLFLRPRPGSGTASVGVVAGSGPVGMRLTNTKLYLDAGYPFPDLILFGAARAAGDGEGILAAGFFGLDWSLGSGEMAWAGSEGIR